MVDIVLNNETKHATYEYIINKLNQEGALHFSLIDPDPFNQSPNKAAKMAKLAEQAGTEHRDRPGPRCGAGHLGARHLPHPADPVRGRGPQRDQAGR